MARRLKGYNGAGDVRGYGLVLPTGPRLYVGLGLAAIALYLIFRKSSVVQQVEASVKNVVSTLAGLPSSAAWAKGLYDVLGVELPQLGVIGKLIAVAQAAVESGWGKTKQAREGNNFWNITAGPAWTGTTMIGHDVSYTAANCQRLGIAMVPQPNGKLACPITQVWRTYPSVNAAVADYWRFLGGRYIEARNALESGDVPLFAQKLREKQYYDAPLDEYTTSMAAVVKTAARFVGVTV